MKQKYSHRVIVKKNYRTSNLNGSSFFFFRLCFCFLHTEASYCFKRPAIKKKVSQSAKSHDNTVYAGLFILPIKYQDNQNNNNKENNIVKLNHFPKFDRLSWLFYSYYKRVVSGGVYLLGWG